MATADSQSILHQITQLVAANQELQRENKDLRLENERFKTQLRDIGDALGQVTGGRGRGRRRRAAEVPPERARRQRKPITDPEVLEKRRQAMAKARQARQERLAASRSTAVEESEP